MGSWLRFPLASSWATRVTVPTGLLIARVMNHPKPAQAKAPIPNKPHSILSRFAERFFVFSMSTASNPCWLLDHACELFFNGKGHGRRLSAQPPVGHIPFIPATNLKHFRWQRCEGCSGFSEFLEKGFLFGIQLVPIFRQVAEPFNVFRPHHIKPVFKLLVAGQEIGANVGQPPSGRAPNISHHAEQGFSLRGRCQGGFNIDDLGDIPDQDCSLGRRFGKTKFCWRGDCPGSEKSLRFLFDIVERQPTFPR